MSLEVAIAVPQFKPEGREQVERRGPTFRNSYWRQEVRPWSLMVHGKSFEE